MSKIIPKKPALVYNSIEHQSKTAANSLTIAEWNRVVNILKQQANLNTKYLEDLHRMLFYDWNSDDSGYAVGKLFAVFSEHPDGVDIFTILEGKVDKVPGMGLSKNNFTDDYKNKVDSVIGDVTQLQNATYEHMSLMDNPHGVTPEQIGAYTKEEVDGKIATAMRYKGSVPFKEDLPTTDNAVGDFYNVLDDGINYAWDGEKWDMVGGFTDVRLIEVSGSDVVETLRDGFDFTFTSDLNSMILTIPSNVSHGYFSGFNFKTKTSTIGITFVNESSMPLKLFKFSKELSSIYLNPNKTVNASLHSDGFNIYCYYIEV